PPHPLPFPTRRSSDLPGSAIAVIDRTTLPCGTGSPRRVGDCGVGGWLDPRDRGRGRRGGGGRGNWLAVHPMDSGGDPESQNHREDRKSTRLNSSHGSI